MSKVKIEKYCIAASKISNWLSQPGLVIYVENNYESSINRSILMNIKDLEYKAYAIGCQFIYLPDFLSSCDEELYKYMTGKYPVRYQLLFKRNNLESILGSDLFHQLQGPSLLFTGLTDKNEHELYKLQFIERISRYDRNHKELRTVLDSSCLEAIFEDYADIHQILTLNASIIEESETDIEKDIILRRGEDETNFMGHQEASMMLDLSKCAADFKEPSPFGNITLSNEEKIVRDRAQKLIQKLLDEGLSQEAIWAFFAPEQKLSTLKITAQYHIILPEYDNMEIPLPAIQKAVYFLFLKHPEGINFKCMYDYRDELLAIYRKLAERGTTEKLISTVDDLVNPFSNAMNEKCSRIKNMFCYYLTDNLAKHYYISGDKGERKHICLDSSKITWMKEI